MISEEDIKYEERISLGKKFRKFKEKKEAKNRMIASEFDVVGFIISGIPLGVTAWRSTWKWSVTAGLFFGPNSTRTSASSLLLKLGLFFDCIKVISVFYPGYYNFNLGNIL